METRKVAENIVRDLNNLDLRSKAIQKIAFSYTEKQIEIVLSYLRHLSEASTRPDKPEPDEYLEGIMKKGNDSSGG